MPEPLAEPIPVPAFDSEAADRAIRGMRRRPRAPGGLLAGMRIRKKLIVLHTCFSLGLAAILLVALRPAVLDVVREAESSHAALALRAAVASSAGVRASEEDLSALLGPDVAIRRLDASEDELDARLLARARARPGEPIAFEPSGDAAAAVAFVPGADDAGEYWVATIRIAGARRAVLRIYALALAAVLAVYALVAASLEIFVLPQHVYGPIRSMLLADQALQQGDKAEELIPESAIPADELGEIMRSRNRSVVALRRHEQALAEALGTLEQVATDLKRKNHLLEAAQRNLADADRLASLGMMSAGLAHELNTPLAVLKGLVEKLNQDPRKGIDPAQAALMRRVVLRLERLGESLLDFARLRPPRTAPVALRPLVDEATTLVRLDREARDVVYENRVPEGLVVECDGDRMVQVMVNLLRNATDAVRSRGGRAESPGPTGRVTVAAETATRDGRPWVSLTVTDDGPGIDPDLLSRLFEPFASTRLDARGTGLGLAVSEGIVREHGGLILARNRSDGPGAVFEVMLPLGDGRYAAPNGPAAPRPAARV